MNLFTKLSRTLALSFLLSPPILSSLPVSAATSFSPFVFKGASAMALFDSATCKFQFATGSGDPSSVAVDACKGSIYCRTGSSGGTCYTKSDDGSSTNWLAMLTASTAISDTAYNATSWDSVTTVAPSKNAVRDQIETMLTSIATKVVGPASSTDNAIMRFDLATGKLSQNSTVLVDDSGNITGAGNITAKASTALTLKTADDAASGDSAALTSKTGDVADGGATSGANNISTGTANGGISGAINIITGAGDGGGSSGNLVIKSGTASGGSRGTLQLQDGITITSVGAVDMGGQSISTLPNPTTAQEPATKAYADSNAPWVNGLVNEFIDFDEFMDISHWGISIGTFGNSTTGIAANTPGLMRLQTGATSAGAYKLTTIPPGGGTITFEASCRLNNLSDDTNDFVVRIGFCDDYSAGAITTCVNGLVFKYNDNTNSGKWTLSTSKASTETTGNTNTTAETTLFHRYKIVLNAAATSAAFYYDGVEVSGSPLTTNLPNTTSNALGPEFLMGRTLGVTNRTMSCDWYYTRMQFTTPRT